MNNDERLKVEFNNNLYDVVIEAIIKTIRKYGYEKYDIAKLLIALDQKNYEYIVHNEEYREQIEMLDNYFKSQFNHNLITFIMLKTIESQRNADNYDEVLLNISSIESLIRTGISATKDNLEEFFKLLKEEKYNEIMEEIESKQSLKFALAVVCDKIIESQQ